MLCLLYKGKDLTEDLKTLKDFGMRSLQPDGIHSPVKIILTLKSSFELQNEIQVPEHQFTDQEISEGIETLKAFLGDLSCSEEVTILALKKCKLNLEDVLIMVTNPD